MSLSVVARIIAIEPHPNPEITRIEIVRITQRSETRTAPRVPFEPPQATLVTGKHYEVGQLGVWIRPGAWMAGWLAEDLWQGGKKSWFHVEERDYFGVKSPGLFAGETFRKAPDRPIEPWKYWQSRWEVGDEIDDYLGLLNDKARYALDMPEVM